MVSVVVPPDGVKTDETTYDEATETEVDPPFEVSTVTELTVETDEALTNDEAETGIVAVDPPSVVMVSVKYGVDVAGVEMVTVDPDGVVTVTVSGVGTWRVAIDPDEVSTGTDDSQVGMVTVAVFP
jgi:hypothetical protein